MLEGRPGPDATSELIIAIGRAYHQAGVPVDAVEETMRASAAALAVELQVTALPTSIMAAIGPRYAQRVVLLRLEPGVVDLRKLSLLNAIYETVLARTVAVSEALAEVERIGAASPAAPPIVTIGAYCALSVGAATILGGHAVEFEASACIGVLVGGLAVAARYVPAVDRLFEVLAGVVATLVVTAFVRAGAHLEVYVPVVAGVIQLLPGLQLTEALHELAYRNVVAGTARLGSAMMTLLSLGCGFALGVAIVGPSAMHLTRMSFAPLPWFVLALAAFAMASGIAVLQRARFADYPWVLASCGVAELAFRIFSATPGFQVATFGGALAVGIAAKLGSRYAKVPETILLIPGLLILVPGALSYESILYVLQSDTTSAGTVAVTSVVAAVEIVSGLLLAQLFFTPVRRRG
jgi:uncharacterized membrane protein YjjP (DUF1212 family)